MFVPLLDVIIRTDSKFHQLKENLHTGEKVVNTEDLYNAEYFKGFQSTKLVPESEIWVCLFEVKQQAAT